MQTCDNIDINKTVAPEDIFSRFQYISYLNSGATSDVYKVLDTFTDTIYAMKVVNETCSFEDEDEDCDYVPYKEINTLCRFFNTLDYTHSLSIPKYWTLSNKQIIYKKKKNEILFLEGSLAEVFIFPLYQYTLNDLINSIDDPKWLIDNILSFNDIQSIFFELKIAIQVLSQIGIQHADLKLDNIMIHKNNVPRVYNINGKMYKIDSQFMPVIIDFGVIEETTEISKLLISESKLMKIYNHFGIPINNKLLTINDNFVIDSLSAGTYTLFSPMNISN